MEYFLVNAGVVIPFNGEGHYFKGESRDGSPRQNHWCCLEGSTVRVVVGPDAEPDDNYELPLLTGAAPADANGPQAFAFSVDAEEYRFRYLQCGG